MKVDRYAKDLSKKLDSFSNGNGNYDDDTDDDSYRLTKQYDEYYLDRGSVPPRFAYYRHIRIEKSTDEWRKKTFEAANDSITQDELDFILKRNLRIPPEERYQREKKHWYWHESSWCSRGLDATGYDGQGCNQFTGPEQPYHLKPENCARITKDNPGDISFDINHISPCTGNGRFELSYGTTELSRIAKR